MFITLLLAAFLSQSAAPSPQVGTVAFPNSGAAAAQGPFLTGLAQLHNFEYADAAQWFRKAQDIDPGFALAYWGEAMTYNHPVWMEQDIAAARRVLKRLAETAEARLGKAPTERERAYVGAVEILYGEGDKETRDVAYADAMADLHRRFPDDADGTAFYALALLGTAHEGRDFATYMKAAALLEPLFPAHPNHPGIAHYLIHSYDDPVHAPLGLRSARAYSKIAPSAAHAQHMCSHIFVATGLWDDVVAANEAAMSVVASAGGRTGPRCGHYPLWLEYGYLQQGRFGEARKMVADCLAAARDTAAPPRLPEAFAAMRARYLLDTAEWSGEVAAWTIPGAGPAPTMTLEFATGYAAAERGDLPAARAALERYMAARSGFDASKTGKPDPNAAGRVKILGDELTALIRVREGAVPEGIGLLRSAAAAEEALPFEFGPPFIDKPAYELLGDVLLAAGQPKEALDAFQKALARTPRRTAALAGLMRAAEKSGDSKKAAAAQAELRAIWRRADRLPSDWQ